MFCVHVQCKRALHTCLSFPCPRHHPAPEAWRDAPRDHEDLEDEAVQAVQRRFSATEAVSPHTWGTSNMATNGWMMLKRR